jgi:antitoxin component YwqK of YwqJK toxin-antitoxin module
MPEPLPFSSGSPGSYADHAAPVPDTLPSPDAPPPVQDLSMAWPEPSFGEESSGQESPADDPPFPPISGPVEERDEAGNLVLATSLEKGVLQGPVTLWDDAGRPALKATFRDGVPHGPMTVFAEGRRQMTLTFVQGRQHGPAATYGPDETVLSQMSWVEGVLEGEARHFDPLGRQIRVERYVAGKLHGPATDYYPTGAIQQTSHWVEGVLHGEQVTYGADGTQLSRVLYENGEAKPQGAAPSGPQIELPPASVRDRLLAQIRGKAP